jgi:hypothetical protein
MQLTYGRVAVAIATALFIAPITGNADGFRFDTIPLDANASLATQKVADYVDPLAGMVEGGRVLMRHSDGSISAVVIQQNGGTQTLQYLASQNGKEWRTQALPMATGERAVQPALDGNSGGTYVAYVSITRKGRSGHVLSVNSTGNQKAFRDSGALTNVSGNQYSFIAASRMGYKSVAYGWFDPETGAVNIGISPDGATFPRARPIVTDKDAIYGPSVAILGRYVAVSYLTRNAAIAPAGADRRAAYMAWLESADGGATWTKPIALFGRIRDAFPHLSVEAPGGSNSRTVILSGVDPKLPDFNQSLAWPAATISNSRVFISSALQYQVAGDRSGDVGVVSFKLPTIGGMWTHVIAGQARAADTTPAGLTTWFHQYSALPETPLRVVSYLERAKNTAKNEEELVFAISTDQGKRFDRFARYSAKALGLPTDSRLVVLTSPCLWRDSSGAISIDVFAAPLTASNAAATVTYVNVPLPLRVQGGTGRSTQSAW